LVFYLFERRPVVALDVLLRQLDSDRSVCRYSLILLFNDNGDLWRDRLRSDEWVVRLRARALETRRGRVGTAIQTYFKRPSGLLGAITNPRIEDYRLKLILNQER
jgi:hypothetical protein